MKLKHLIHRSPLAATLLLAFSGPLTVRGDYASTVLSFNPLAYWRFNETATSPALNKTTNSSSMGSILDGYVVADAKLGEPGIVGQSDNGTVTANGTFANNLSNWTAFGTITAQVSGEVAQFIRPTNDAPSGVLLQPTNTAVAAGQVVTASFRNGKPTTRSLEDPDNRSGRPKSMASSR